MRKSRGTTCDWLLRGAERRCGEFFGVFASRSRMAYQDEIVHSLVCAVKDVRCAQRMVEAALRCV